MNGTGWECLLFPFLYGTGILKLRRLFKLISSSLFIYKKPTETQAMWVAWEKTAGYEETELELAAHQKNR